jgi:hypothetical protein
LLPRKARRREKKRKRRGALLVHLALDLDLDLVLMFLSPFFLNKNTHQIRALNSGTFGFVELCADRATGQQVAVKFIERGDKVSCFL